MSANGGIPTLSQVRGWTTEYLTEAAEHWTRTAVVWEESFSALADQISSPGGIPWEGEAADAAFARAYSDRLTVIGLADELHAAACIARRGVDQIDGARGAVLRVVDAAEEAGFVVGEDFSVTRPGAFPSAPAAMMQAQAETIADELRTKVGTLVATDTELATGLANATATLGTTVFPESADEPSTSANKPAVQFVDLVDYKQDVPDPNQPGPSSDEIRKVLDELPGGNRPGIREVRTPEDLQTLWKWMAQNGIDVGNRYPDGKGVAKSLPDGVTIGQRFSADSTRQPVLDIRFPGDGGYVKVHINPRGGVPDIPVVRLPAAPEPPPVRSAPIEEAPIEIGRGVGAGPLPGGPTFVPPPHSIHHLPVLGEDDLDAPWEYGE